ncbi:MAG: hypothetical protein QOH97_3264 [Actinoplanes sp.]|jgi:hypothetical protein|nr:hypothetical protein [Actinoplanes sp.]
MTAPGNNIVELVLALAFVVSSGYASGRLHQWYRHGRHRDNAYREGYDHASRSMFDLAVRSRTAGRPGSPAARHLTGAPRADRRGDHRRAA